jgi:hypothetical protein
MTYPSKERIIDRFEAMSLGWSQAQWVEQCGYNQELIRRSMASTPSQNSRAVSQSTKVPAEDTPATHASNQIAASENGIAGEVKVGDRFRVTQNAATALGVPFGCTVTVYQVDRIKGFRVIEEQSGYTCKAWFSLPYRQWERLPDLQQAKETVEIKCATRRAGKTMAIAAAVDQHGSWKQYDFVIAEAHERDATLTKKLAKAVEEQYRQARAAREKATEEKLKPIPLPFKRHPSCDEKAVHMTARMCEKCERLIAWETGVRVNKVRLSPETGPAKPAYTARGGAVFGSWNGRVPK